MKRINITILIVIFFTINQIQPINAQITRGASQGEIYISTDWYMDNYGDIHYAIFHSTNNGENITLKYENIENPPTGEMQVGKVLGDATLGALYNYGSNELWVSFNYGESWDFVEDYAYSGFYTSGSNEGVMYKNGTDVAGTLYFSNDYGTIFTAKNEDIKFFLEVGTEIGELYGKSGSAGVGYNIKYSNDYGLNFLTIPIDSSVAFWQIGGYHPRISRGTEHGELYLVSWWPNSTYKIFHSIDTGYNWTQKYESDYINLYYWRVFYTAGREPGSFYVMRSRINPVGDHIWLYIDYSTDYGVTFTTYFHDLDSTITVIKKLYLQRYELKNYPNPFNYETKIQISEEYKRTYSFLQIIDISGKIIRKYTVHNKDYILWDGTDKKGNKINSGIYFYSITGNNIMTPLNKIVFINQNQ